MDITLHKRILEISYKNELSHLSSSLTAVDIIDQLYQMKKKDDPFILSAGHAALALYCVLEKYERKNAEKLWKKHGTHPNRDIFDGIHCSTGSLGHGLPIAVGMASANRHHDVFCLISDGECAEGSIWESLRIASEQKLSNLYIAVNANGYTATGTCDVERLEWRMRAFMQDDCPRIIFVRTSLELYPYLEGVDGHYKKLTKEEYEKDVLQGNSQKDAGK